MDYFIVVKQGTMSRMQPKNWRAQRIPHSEAWKMRHSNTQFTGQLPDEQFDKQEFIVKAVCFQGYKKWGSNKSKLSRRLSFGEER